jgi:hypothetical protein
MAFRKIQTTNLVSTETAFSDPVVVFGKDNTSATDIGFLGKLSANTFAGLIRDSATNEFLLIDNYTQVDANNEISAASATLADLAVDGITVDTTFVAPKGTAAQRPSSPVEGQIWFNTDTKMFEGYDGTNWVVFIPATLQIV